MNVVDTLAPTTAGQVAQWADYIEQGMMLLLNPALIAVVINIVLLQVIEAFDRFLPASFCTEGTHEIDHGIRFALAWIATVPATALACWLMQIPFRGTTAGFSLLAGPVAFVVNGKVLKPLGLDLDRWFGDGPTAPPAPPAA